MEILFTNAEGKHLRWDGMLWSSPDEPAAAALLNLEPLGWGSQHGSLLDRARRRAADALGAVEMTQVDLTGMPEEDIGEDVIWAEEELAGGEDAGQCEPHDGTTEKSPAGSALAEAQNDLGGGVCPDGTFDGDATEEDWETPERQWSQLHLWCAARGMILDAPEPEISGGREHDVVFDEERQCWVKYTKPGMAGYMVDWHEDGRPWLRNALPLEYLARLTRQNELVQDDIKLAGLWREGTGGWRIVTTQPHVRGPRATMGEISEGMAALGFVKMGWTGIGYEDSTAWRIGRMGMWDVHPANVIMTENGVVVPVDVIIAELPHGYAPCHFHPEANFLKRSPKL